MKCPKCTSGIIEKVNGNEPFNEDHLQCNNCDSTFNIEEINTEKITKNNFLQFGFKELPNNQFELTGNVKGGGTYNLTILWNGVDWYFPKTDTSVHLFRTHSDLKLFLNK